MKARLWILPVALLLMAALTGCRKDLCYDHDTHGLQVRLYVDADWEQEWERTYDYDWQQLWRNHWTYLYDDLRPGVPEGIRTVAYNENGRYAEGNLEAEGGRVYLAEGTSDLLLYNNDTEYIVFNDLAASVEASATTRTITRASFREMHQGERTVNQPDILYGAYIEDHKAQLTSEPVTLPVTLRPLVYTYMIRYEFSYGQKYIALARGALAGMAESVYLNDGHTGPQAATVMFDCTLQSYGAEALVQSFGVPDYPGEHYTRADRVYTLNLEVRMTNGKFKNWTLDVTDQVTGQPRGGVIIIPNLEITDEEGGGVGGGFDVDVSGWGEYEDIEIPVN